MFVKRNFIENNINEIAAWVERDMLEEKTAKAQGLLQCINPNIKLLSLLSFLMFSLLTHNICIIGIIYVLSCLLAFVSGINLFYFLRRVWIFIPLFTVIIAVPALFVTPGTVLIKLGMFTITRQGFWAAVFLILRVVTAVSFSTLLILTTEWHKLFSSLRTLKVPDFIIFVTMLCYRYVFVLLNLFSKFLFARRSRLIKEASWRDSLRFTAQTLGMLFIRSIKLAEEVYLAMKSRGFNGDINTNYFIPLTASDYLWTAFVFVMIGVLVWKG